MRIAFLTGPHPLYPLTVDPRKEQDDDDDDDDGETRSWIPFGDHPIKLERYRED